MWPLDHNSVECGKVRLSFIASKMPMNEGSRERNAKITLIH